jgi:hypothetical protein
MAFSLIGELSHRRPFIIGVVGIVLVVAVTVYILHSRAGVGVTESYIQQGKTVIASASNQTSQPSPQVSTPSTQQFYDMLVKSNTLIDESGEQAQFGVVSVTQPLSGWFIVTIAEEGEGSQISKAIFYQKDDTTSSLSLFAPPSISFPPEKYNLPNIVRKAL